MYYHARVPFSKRAPLKYQSEFAFDGPFFNRNYSFTNNSTYIFRIKLTFTAKGRCLNFFAKEINVRDFNSLLVQPIIYDYVYNEKKPRLHYFTFYSIPLSPPRSANSLLEDGIK